MHSVMGVKTARARFAETALTVSLLTAFAPALAASPAMAAGGPGGGPHQQCLDDCRALRAECASACTQDFRDCVRIARTDMRGCREGCQATFEPESEELAVCVEACRAEVLAPAREACIALRGDCTPECRPGNCRRGCRPGGGVVDEADRECLRGCITDLHDCALGGKQALRECLAPCGALEPGAEREACFHACAESAREGHAACGDDFGLCKDGCSSSPTTTLLP